MCVWICVSVCVCVDCVREYVCVRVCVCPLQNSKTPPELNTRVDSY